LRFRLALFPNAWRERGLRREPLLIAAGNADRRPVLSPIFHWSLTRESGPANAKNVPGVRV
jgi:hypothetical protein